jgi:tRNA A-37 threonylcarbamoyl transferase component Bud32
MIGDAPGSSRFRLEHWLRFGLGRPARLPLNSIVKFTGPESVPPGLAPGPDLARLQSGKVRWTIRRNVPRAWLGEILANPDRFLADPGQLIADSHLITLAKIPPLNPEGVSLVLRRLNYGQARHRWRDVFRPTRAERAFRHGLGLERAGVATPRALAVGVQRFLRWPRRAYLVTEWVPGAITLQDLLDRERQLPREQVYQLADLLARLHNHGFSHRDLKSSNVLFDDRLQPQLIDLDGVRSFGRLGERRAVADLTRFAWEFVKYPRFLKWNGRRFLKRYCQQRRLEDSRRRLDAEISRPLMQRLATGITYWKR